MTKVDERTLVQRVDSGARERLALALDRDPVAAAYLFGSQASGAAGALSDVDLAVALAPGADRAAAHSDLLIAVIEALGTDEVDLVILDGAPPLLRQRVLRDGVRLVDRDPRARVRFETRALLDYLDTAPLRGVLAAGRRRRLEEGRFGRR
jgi:predicted nucleotidyltransferase